VAGYRVHKDGGGVGSLLLGLFDTRGALHHVGVASGMAVALRARLADEVADLRMDTYDGHPWAAWKDPDAHERRLMPGTPSRWSGARQRGGEVDWVPLRPERVAEVRYEHVQGARFRHPARFVRWRPDRDPASCTYSQLVETAPAELEEWFG
jgi:ATP-dependent DNA ligase